MKIRILTEDLKLFKKKTQKSNTITILKKGSIITLIKIYGSSGWTECISSENQRGFIYNFKGRILREVILKNKETKVYNEPSIDSSVNRIIKFDSRFWIEDIIMRNGDDWYKIYSQNGDEMYINGEVRIKKHEKYINAYRFPYFILLGVFFGIKGYVNVQDSDPSTGIIVLLTLPILGFFIGFVIDLNRRKHRIKLLKQIDPDFKG